MQPKTNGTAKTIWSMALSFLICLLLFLGSNLLILLLTAKPEHIVQIAIQSDYYTLLTGEIRESLYDLGDISGLEHSVFHAVVTTQRVEEDSDAYLSGAMVGKTVVPDTAALSAAFRNAILAGSDQAKQKQGNAAFVKALRSFSDQCAAAYKQKIAIAGLPEAGRAVAKLRQAGAAAAVGIILLTALLAAVLYGIQSWKHRFLRYLSYSFSGAAAMLLLFPGVLWALGFPSRLGLTAQSLFTMVRQLAASIFKGQLVCAVVFLLLFVLMLLVRRKVTRGVE